MSRVQLRILIVTAVGLLAGAVIAVAVPRTRGEARTATPAAFARIPGPARVATPRSRERGSIEPGGQYLRLRQGTMREALRRRDPAGGADWVVRSYDADRMTPVSMRRKGSDGVQGVSRCDQLGREVGGRFGWIDGSNTFRPVLPSSYGGAPTECGTRRRLARREPALQLTTLVAHPTDANRAILGSVLWGALGGRGASATIETAGRTLHPTPTGAGAAFLSFLGPDRSASDALLRVRYPDGSTTSREVIEGVFGPRARAGLDLASKRIVARTSDPGGGPSIGLAGVRRTDGGWCVGDIGAIVGDRVGQLDPIMGTLLEQSASFQAGACGDGPDQFPPGGVVRLSSRSGTATDVPALDPGRRALRLQPGRTFLYGTTRSDVRLLTFRTPRDVRTIRPTPPAHAFALAYDGAFTGGTVEIIATLRDGSTRTLRQPVGF